MRIEIQRASNLGQLHRQLGIASDSRISFQMNTDGQIEIWDLDTGRYFTIRAFDTPPTVYESEKQVPDWVREIIEAEGGELLKRYREGWREGAGEKRMAMFTELCYRGINVLER
jgi:hypothetical protein